MHEKCTKRKNSNDTDAKVTDLKNNIYGELGYVFAALSINFNNSDDKYKSLLQKKFNLCRTKVISVRTEKEITEALKEASMQRLQRGLGVSGERHIIYVKSGTYKIDSVYWKALFLTIIVGDLAGQKPLFLIESDNMHLICKQIFVNVHFKMKNAQLSISLLESPMCFIDCKFESFSPIFSLHL